MVDANATIQVLSDNVLISVFSFLRSLWHPPNFSYVHEPSLTWEWHRLAHVCQRWRYLIFASPRRLGLGLITGWKRPGTNLDLWPPLPISICYDLAWLSSEDEQGVVATLEHPDRIFAIKLAISEFLVEESNAWMGSFPVLERLDLKSPSSCHLYTVLPSGFLGGSTLASRGLRHIVLESISVPTLPQLLSSCHGLIHLHLGKDVLSCGAYLSPAVLSTALSAAARLESLHVYPPNKFHKRKRKARTDSGLPTSSLVVLPALIHFKYEGSLKYLEDFVSRIHAPLLERIYVGVPQQQARPLDIPQLAQFISRTEHMSSLPLQTSVYLDKSSFKISHDFEIRGHISFELTCHPGFAQVSQVVHICRQLSPLVPDVERVSIEVDIVPPNPPEETDITGWLQLFRLFCGAQEVEFRSEYLVYEGHNTPKMGQAVFPALRILRLDVGWEVPRFIESFVTERQLTGRPVTVIHRCGPCSEGGSYADYEVM